MDSALLSLLQTTDDRSLLLDELALVSAAFFFSDPEKKELVLRDQVRASAAMVFRPFLTLPDGAQALSRLREEILALPTLRLTLAFEPTPRQIQGYTILLHRLTEGASMLLDISVDPQCIGGAIISFQGRRFDYSLHTFINQYLVQNKEKILQHLHPYAQAV